MIIVHLKYQNIQIDLTGMVRLDRFLVETMVLVRYTVLHSIMKLIVMEHHLILFLTQLIIKKLFQSQEILGTINGSQHFISNIRKIGVAVQGRAQFTSGEELYCLI